MTFENRRAADTPPSAPLDKHPVWTAMNAVIVKIIPPLLAVSVVGITGGAWATFNSVNKLTDKVAQHELELEALRKRIDSVEASGIKRQELLEILKRVEQQLEIALLRSGVRVPPKVLSSGGQQ